MLLDNTVVKGFVIQLQEKSNQKFVFAKTLKFAVFRLIVNLVAAASERSRKQEVVRNGKFS